MAHLQTGLSSQPSPPVPQSLPSSTTNEAAAKKPAAKKPVKELTKVQIATQKRLEKQRLAKERKEERELQERRLEPGSYPHGPVRLRDGPPQETTTALVLSPHTSQSTIALIPATAAGVVTRRQTSKGK